MNLIEMSFRNNCSMFLLSNNSNYNYSTGYVGTNISMIMENSWGVNNMNNGSSTLSSRHSTALFSGCSAPFYSGYC